MRVLYIGDIMGKPGRKVVAHVLPSLRKKYAIDLVAAQAENVTHGTGMNPDHMRELQKVGVDVFTGGNHSVERPSLHPLLDDPNEPVLAPANMRASKPAWGAKLVTSGKERLLFVSLLGSTVPEPLAIDNPLKTIDDILKHFALHAPSATIVNFHGDYSSEKRVIGFYLDGRVSAVIGDHWHVPTADAMVLPKGTAHITDVGMCGTLYSSLGVTKEIIIERWRHDITNRSHIDEAGPYQFNAVLLDISTRSYLAKKIRPIQLVLEKTG